MNRSAQHIRRHAGKSSGRRAVMLAVVCAAAIVGLRAQDPVLVRDHPGVWRPLVPNFRTTATPDDRVAATKIMTAVFDVLRRTPALASLKGYDALPGALITVDRPGGGKRPEMIDLELSIDLPAYERTSQGVVAVDSDAAAIIRIAVNRLTMVTGGASSDFGDDNGDFRKGEPEVVDTQHGAPVYEGGSDRWVILRRGQIPITIAVTRGRYLAYRSRSLQTQIDRAQTNLAKYSADDPSLAGPLATLRDDIAQMKALETSLQRQIASLSPAERDAPTWVTDDLPTGAPSFAAPGADGADPVVELNPALFAGRTRTAVGVLAVSVAADGDHWPDLADTLDRQIDWPALKAIVTK